MDISIALPRLLLLFVFSMGGGLIIICILSIMSSISFWMSDFSKLSFSISFLLIFSFKSLNKRRI